MAKYFTWGPHYMVKAVRKAGANRLVADDIPAALDEEMPQQAIVSAFRKYTK